MGAYAPALFLFIENGIMHAQLLAVAAWFERMLCGTSGLTTSPSRYKPRGMGELRPGGPGGIGGHVGEVVGGKIDWGHMAGDVKLVGADGPARVCATPCAALCIS